MEHVKKIAIYLMALFIIGLLFFFAFTFFIIILALLPIIYLIRKFRSSSSSSQPQQKTDHSSEKTIDAEYEVIEESSSKENEQDKTK